MSLDDFVAVEVDFSAISRAPGGLSNSPRGSVESCLVVFVRKSPGRSGSTKVQIAERRAGRDVVLEHVGTARSDLTSAIRLSA